MNHTERIEDLESKIREGLALSEEHVIFEYHNYDDKVDLEVFTINPKHQQTFLYNSAEGRDKIEALERMVEYVVETDPAENIYTVQWNLKGDNKLQTSYFRAKNIMDALDKFYFGRDFLKVNVFSAVLNPVS